MQTLVCFCQTLSVSSSAGSLQLHTPRTRLRYKVITVLRPKTFRPAFPLAKEGSTPLVVRSCCLSASVVHVALNLSSLRANSAHVSLSCFCTAARRAQNEPPGSAVAWWFPATKGCPASLTCPSKRKTCGRFHGSRCSSSSALGMGSLGRSGWVRIRSLPEDEVAGKEAH